MAASARHLCAAVITMLAVGIFYLWGVFLLGLERDLALPRSTLSLVSSAALVSCTCGFLLYDRMLRMLPLQLYAALVYALAAIGHLTFGLAPGFASLLIGYGFMFGLAVGFGYGLALALAARSPSGQGVAISVVVSAFAVSGVILGAIGPKLFAGVSVAQAFVWIGLAVAACGVLTSLLLIGAQPFRQAADAANARLGPIVRSPLFLKLAFAFFVFNYCGLMLVSHGAGLLMGAGFSAETAAMSPVVLNLSYIAGSLIGGRAGETIPMRALLLSALGAVAAAIVLLQTSTTFALLAVGIGALGLTFGGAAACVPVLIGRLWGASRINGLYGVMLLAYGSAGVLAPSISAVLFSSTGDYSAALWLALAISFGGLVATASLGGAALRRVTPGA